MASSHQVISEVIMTNTSPDRKELNQIHEIPTSWPEIRKLVHGMRKTHSQFANKIPHDFVFVDPPAGENHIAARLLFLGVLHNQRENTLLYMDIPKSHDPDFLDKPVEWKLVIGFFKAGMHIGKYSKEEELMRERKRLSIHGITSFQVSSSKIIFPASGSLYMINVEDIGMSSAVDPVEIVTQCSGCRMDPKMSPNDPNIIAFIHDNDIWVTTTQNGCEMRMTFTHNSNPVLKSAVDQPISAGVASYIVQEEFDRYTGYWWQPNNQSDQHRILYELVDESNVEILQIPNPVTSQADAYRYPKSGTANATVSLRVVEFNTSDDGQVTNVVTYKLSESLKEIFPWMEYIVRVDWLPDGRGIWAQLLDRKQIRSTIVYVPLGRFDKIVSFGTSQMTLDDNDVEMNIEPQNQPSVKILYEEISDVWINVHDTFYYMKKQRSPDEITFIWASEHTGHRHLYLIDSNLKRGAGSKRHSTGDLVENESRYCSTTLTPLTSGNWEVLEVNNSLWVDEVHEKIYFMGLKDSVLETHLYISSYSSPGPPVRITQPSSSHSVSMSKDCQHFVTVSSSINELYSAKVYNLDRRPNVIVNLLEPQVMTTNYIAPELFSFSNTNGDILHGFFIKPLHMESGKKYPTVLYVYGGPHVQLVSNSFKGLRHQRLSTLSALGYLVVTIDGRGATHRGLKFESHIKHKMGQVEIEDQVEGLKYLATKVDFIDLSRVAIHGWSYGGYLSLMGIAQRPDIFKVSVAGAPVVCWENYDTGYTERYMSTPSDNTRGYKEGSVLSHIGAFPNQPNRLLLVHGLIDENVHFVHTALLVNALIKNCKPYQLQVYPCERHGIRNPESNEHFEVAVISFLQQNL